MENKTFPLYIKKIISDKVSNIIWQKTFKVSTD